MRVYLDNNSTTKVDPKVIEAMVPFFDQYYGNPSNLHYFGRKAKEAVEQAREKVAQLINATASEIIFTANGTEANNLAIKGILKTTKQPKPKIITSSIEHSSIRNTLSVLQQSQQAEIVELSVDEYGVVNLEELKQKIDERTVLVTVMHCNNEVGTIEPIQEIATIAHKYNAYFLTDAVASVGKLPIDVKSLDIDMLTLSGHKIHGPKGIGALYLKDGINLAPLIVGGGQERHLRAGTENVPGIVGLGVACELALAEIKSNIPKQIETLRNYLEEQIKNQIPEIKINGHPTNRVCNVLNISVAYVEGESVLMNLDLEGIAVASGSACASAKSEPSHVLKAMNVPDKFINSPVRFSLSKYTTKEEIDYTIEKLITVIKRLRAISPLWKG
ncbi:MAG: cysteine desulfurase family protein [candidate division WOR-3 bacterium]